MDHQALEGVTTRPAPEVTRAEGGLIYMTKKQAPIITHTEILSRAIRSITQEIDEWRGNCDKLPNGEKIFGEATDVLSAKLAALKDLYRIETGNDY